ncbi:hypothetical protein D3C86_1870890 [compost metagenome]
MVRRHVDCHLGLHRQANHADAGGINVACLRKANLCALFLQQIDNVLFLANQALKLRVRETLVELDHQILQHVRVERVRKDKGQPGFGLRRQRNCQLIQTRTGGQNRLHITQHLFALLG